jgi:hypothetical protein
MNGRGWVERGRVSVLKFGATAKPDNSVARGVGFPSPGTLACCHCNDNPSASFRGLDVFSLPTLPTTYPDSSSKPRTNLNF